MSANKTTIYQVKINNYMFKNVLQSEAFAHTPQQSKLGPNMTRATIYK